MSAFLENFHFLRPLWLLALLPGALLAAWAWRMRVRGGIWNELIDLAALEKGDFKGQGAADKIVTVYNALKGNKYKYPEMPVEEALKTTNNAKREVHGAV